MLQMSRCIKPNRQIGAWTEKCNFRYGITTANTVLNSKQCFNSCCTRLVEHRNRPQNVLKNFLTHANPSSSQVNLTGLLQNRWGGEFSFSEKIIFLSRIEVVQEGRVLPQTPEMNELDPQLYFKRLVIPNGPVVAKLQPLRVGHIWALPHSKSCTFPSQPVELCARTHVF